MQLVCGTLFLFAIVLSALAQDLSASYTFQQTLYDEADGSYVLHWSFDSSAETISFAVNVSTTGWVGFGISPNGQMPGSDVVIGWVDSDGIAQFNDRFADERALPPIDASQDWELLSGVEEDGFTILEFTRPFVTCDTIGDLDIGFDTTRVIWSWNTNPMEPPQAGVPHNVRGSMSLNLLGGQENGIPADPDDVDFFDLAVDNVLVPSNKDTTYWCASFELPPDIQNQERFITRISPVLTTHVREYVHHVLIYLCLNDLSAEVIGESGPCSQGSGEVINCQQGLLIGAWAVGGEDFVYPENVAYPVGGVGTARSAVMQMHYDNPDLDENVIDSSGLRFYFTSIPREQRAGILQLGHAVNSLMVIPPNANNYTIAGVCNQECTQSYLPEGGINIFANLLHTHLVGHGLTLQHFRWNTECNVWEELPPIDRNLRYDFNFQQFTYFPQEVTVLPGDLIILKCFYDTTADDINTVTIGGESTREEMCLSFPVYYPKTQLDNCLSLPNLQAGAFTKFIQNITITDPDITARIIEGDDPDAINELAWNPAQIEALQDSILTGPFVSFCSAGNQGGMSQQEPSLPSVDQCSYQAPDTCSVTEQLTCCERVGGGARSLFSFMSITLIVLGVFASTF